MNILATVCGRAGSKGVKSKNIRDFLGYPIAYYTLSALRLFKERRPEHRVTLALNTDSDELFSQFDRTGEWYLRVPRSRELAGDRASKIDVIRETLRFAREHTGERCDVVLDLDLTSPLRRVRDIENVIDALLDTEGAEVAMTVTEARRNPYFNQLAKRPDGFYGTAVQSDFVARQQAPEIYDVNASLYAYRPEFLEKTDTIIIKAKIAVSVMPDTAVLDIDSERDYALMSVLAGHFFKSDPEFSEIRDNIGSFAPASEV